MADLVNTVQREIKGRLEELRPFVLEVQQLEQALRALDGEPEPPKRRQRVANRTSKPVPRRSRRARAPRGETRERILTYVRENPGSTAGQVAGALQLNRNSTGTRMSQLAKAGELKKAARGYEVTSA